MGRAIILVGQKHETALFEEIHDGLGCVYNRIVHNIRRLHDLFTHIILITNILIRSIGATLTVSPLDGIFDRCFTIGSLGTADQVNRIGRITI